MGMFVHSMLCLEAGSNGVSQGSVLRAVLFIIFINDLEEVIV